MTIERQPGLQAKGVPGPQTHRSGAAGHQAVPHRRRLLRREEEFKTKGFPGVTRPTEPHFRSPKRDDTHRVVNGFGEPAGVDEPFQDCS